MCSDNLASNAIQPHRAINNPLMFPTMWWKLFLEEGISREREWREEASEILQYSIKKK